MRKRFQSGEIGAANKHIPGYRYDDELRKYAIIPEEAESVRWMSQMHLDGVSLRVIAENMNNAGIRSITWRTATKPSLAVRPTQRSRRRWNGGHLYWYCRAESTCGVTCDSMNYPDSEIKDIFCKAMGQDARNTVDSLATIRKLKEHKVECYFETKDFYTGKVPKNAEKWAFLGIFWCLGGV